MNNIFNEVNEYRFMDTFLHGTEIMRIHHNTDIIADLSLVYDFIRNNDGIMEYTYLITMIIYNCFLY